MTLKSTTRISQTMASPASNVVVIFQSLSGHNCQQAFVDDSRLELGAAVAREFGEHDGHGIHQGTITSRNFSSGVRTYTITYADGDIEELSVADTFSLILFHGKHFPGARSPEPGARSHQEPPSPTQSPQPPSPGARSPEPGARSHQEPPGATESNPVTRSHRVQPRHHEPESDDQQEEPAHDDLPPPADVNMSPFTWGALEGEEFIVMVNEIYEIVVYWGKHLFLVPNGPQGRAFLAEKTKLLQAFAAAWPMERIAFRALAIMDHLLL